MLTFRKIKVSYCRRVCNCWLTLNVSYVCVFYWKTKLSLIKDVWGSRCTDPRILDLDTCGRCQIQEPAASPQGKGPPVPITIGSGVGPRTWLEDMERREICPYRDWNSGPSVLQPAASCYTDYALQSPLYSILPYNISHPKLLCYITYDYQTKSLITDSNRGRLVILRLKN
jgi:hypothetical protein